MNQEAEEVIKQTHPGFTITCDQCGSYNVAVDSDVGFSSVSGAWGSVDLECADCNNSVPIWDTLDD